MLNKRKLQTYHHEHDETKTYHHEHDETKTYLHEHDETKTKIYLGIKKARQGYGN